jgi:purine-cytosine permease-like protein
MKLIILAMFAASGWSAVGVIVAAIVGAPFVAIGCGVLAVLLWFIGTREADELAADMEWREAKRHPRI